MAKMNPKVDFYFKKTNKWQRELEQLRMFVLDTGLTEVLKWGVPCYTYPGPSSTAVNAPKDGRAGQKNIVLIHVFKEYCALLFFKGSLLLDKKGILIQQTRNVQVARQIRFTSVEEIVKLEPILKSYIMEAIEVEKSGLKVPLKKTSEFSVPAEFNTKLNDNPALKTAFIKLTPGRQRAYLLHFSAPKQSKTRESRIEKSMPQILKGKGLDD